jgi:chemotaxis protein methyltransferase CheR
MASLELTEPVFAILNALVEERLGIHYGLLDRELLQEKAATRALEAGFDSLLDYYYFLRYDPGSEQELGELAEALVVGETYFFREWRPIELLVDTFMVPAVAAGRRPRVWSAGCASGEEPLSLAMLLDDRGMLGETEVLATDISARALERAQAGRFGKRSLRQIPDERLAKRYIREQADQLIIPSRLIEAIRWEKLNLIDEAAYGPMGRFDAILCRNVFIYFADATVRKVLDRLANALRSDGLLLVGVSESLMRHGSGFVGEEHAGVFVYRRARPQ